MSFSTLKTILAADVANGGTFAVGYPQGTNRGDFINGVNHYLVVGQRLYSAPNDFTISFGATTATITWGGTNTLLAGSTVRVQLDQPGAATAIPGTVNTVSCPLVFIDLDNPVATSATSIRAAAAVAGAGAVGSLITAGLTLDVPRNVIITSAGDDSAKTLTVTGKDVYGVVTVETITGANAGVAAGKKAFKSITGITMSAASAGNVSIGIGNVLGFPVNIPITALILVELQDNAVASAGTKVAGLNPLTKSTATTADIRGTYVPNSAPDGSKAYSLIVALPDPTFLGPPQFGG
jgi:hypothetical protein